MRAVALGRPAASVDELPVAPRYLRADLASNQSPCLLLAQSGHAQCADECPLLGVKRTFLIRSLMSVNDPKRTLRWDATPRSCRCMRYGFVDDKVHCTSARRELRWDGKAPDV